MDRSLHIPLNLSKTEQGAWLIQIESTLNSTTCHKCGQEITELHCHDEAIRLRHLPIFEIPVYVEIRPKRFRCRYGKAHTTTQSLNWYKAHSLNTKR